MLYGLAFLLVSTGISTIGSAVAAAAPSEVPTAGAVPATCVSCWSSPSVAEAASAVDGEAGPQATDAPAASSLDTGADHMLRPSADEGGAAEPPHLKLGVDAEPWLPRFMEVLEGNRPRDYVSGMVALIAGDRGARYLVVKWIDRFRPESMFPPLEFHKVVVAPGDERRLRWLRTFREYPYLHELTRQVLFRGEPPVAVVNLWHGGSGTTGMRIRLIQLKRNSVDITPDWAGRLTDVVDLDGDGQYEAITDEWRWRDGLAAIHARPVVEAVLSRVEGSFVHDCRRFADWYRDGAEGDRRLARDRRSADYDVAPFLSRAFLGYVQGGLFDAARALLPELADAATRYPTTEFTAEQAVEDHVDMLEWADRRPEQACPLSGPGMPRGRNGVIERVSSGYPGCSGVLPC